MFLKSLWCGIFGHNFEGVPYPLLYGMVQDCSRCGKTIVVGDLPGTYYVAGKKAKEIILDELNRSVEHKEG